MNSPAAVTIAAASWMAIHRHSGGREALQSKRGRREIKFNCLDENEEARDNKPGPALLYSGYTWPIDNMAFVNSTPSICTARHQDEL